MAKVGEEGFDRQWMVVMEVMITLLAHDIPENDALLQGYEEAKNIVRRENPSKDEVSLLKEALDVWRVAMHHFQEEASEIRLVQGILPEERKR